MHNRSQIGIASVNFDALRYFVAVAEAGSIREAAENLHIAQSALSRQIQNIEAEYSTQLFSRLPRGVALTDAGQVFLRRARDCLAAMTAARDDISALHGLDVGEVRIASIEPLAAEIIPDLISKFHRRHPGISFDVRIGNTRQVLELIRESIAEIGIVYNAPTDPQLRILTSYDQPMVALVAPDHPLAGCTSLSVADIAPYDLAVAPARSPTRKRIDDAAQAEGIKLTIRVESDSVPLRLGIAQREPVVAILAAISAHRIADQGRLRAIPLDGTIFKTSQLQIISLDGKARSRAVVDFERDLYGAIRNLPKWP